eukprot:508839-Rhodomonas_salina.3
MSMQKSLLLRCGLQASCSQSFVKPHCGVRAGDTSASWHVARDPLQPTQREGRLERSANENKGGPGQGQCALEMSQKTTNWDGAMHPLDFPL